MTTRYKALVVVLDRDMREDDAAELIGAIRVLRGVADVQPQEAIAVAVAATAALEAGAKLAAWAPARPVPLWYLSLADVPAHVEDVLRAAGFYDAAVTPCGLRRWYWNDGEEPPGWHAIQAERDAATRLERVAYRLDEPVVITETHAGYEPATLDVPAPIEGPVVFPYLDGDGEPDFPDDDDLA